MFWLRPNLDCYRHSEKLLKLVLKKFYNWQQFKEDEYKDKFLISLSYYLQKKVFQTKRSAKSSTKRSILSHATAS